MMAKIVRILHLSLLLMVVSPGAQALEIKTPLKAVEALGHEMSEMRHMLETFVMIGSGVSYKLPKEQLKTSINLYEDVIAGMEKGFTDDVIQKQIAMGRKGWAPVKQALEISLQDKPSREAMKKKAIFVHGNIRTVIKAMEAMKAHMVTQAKFSAIKELNAAIEIDASARRLSAHYAMAMWKLPDPTIEKHWQKGVAVYTQSLKILEKSLFADDPAFAKNLKITQKMLASFNMMHDMAMGGVFTPAILQKRANKTSQAAMQMVKIILSHAKK